MNIESCQEFLSLEELKNVITVDHNLIYYSRIYIKSKYFCIKTTYKMGFIPITVGTDIKTKIHMDTSKVLGKNIVEYVEVFTYEYIIKRIRIFSKVGLIAMKIIPKTLTLKTKVKGKFLVTEMQPISIDRPFDQKIFSDTSFCQILIRKDLHNMDVIKKFTDEMIRYILEKHDRYLIKHLLAKNQELKDRFDKIKTKFKL